MNEARWRGYSRVLLATVPAMAEALSLHQSLGFRPTEPYRVDPIEGATFLALEL